MKNIVIFASGSGTNAEQIIRYFNDHSEGRVVALFSNRQDSFALTRASQHGIPIQVFSRKDFYETGAVLSELKKIKTDLIVLAGFLWLVPKDLIDAFPGRIINIHPALLPKFGGKGMYGHFVHQAVIAAGETESGISIHLVTQNFDEGLVLFSAKCAVEKNDTPESLAFRIHQLEHSHFPAVIESFLQELPQRI